VVNAQRVQEVRQAIEGLYGPFGGNAERVVVCDSKSLDGVLGRLNVSLGACSALVSADFMASAVHAVRPDVSSRLLDRILSHARENMRVKQALVSTLLGSAASDCIILKSSGNQWVMVLPDVAGVGWRTQAFDERGFSGHRVFETRKKAFEDAVSSGFMERDDAALDRLQDVPKFQRGNFLTDLVFRVNTGQMTHAQADEALAEYDRTNLLCSEIAGGLAQALYVPGSDVIVLVADRIEPGTEQAVYLHEVVHRSGPWVLGETYDRLIDRVLSWGEQALGSAERGVYETAHAAASASAASRLPLDQERALGLYRHEVLAYAVEAAVANGVVPKPQAVGVAGWLDEVVAVFKGMRAQLLGGSVDDVGLEEIVALAHAMAHIDNPERAQQVVEALKAGGEPELAQLIHSRTQELSMEGANWPLFYATRQVYGEDDFWETMVEKSKFQAGPFDGGCLTCALAIQDVAGGELVRIVSQQAAEEHYGVLLDGLVYDFGGVHSSLNQWVKSLESDLDGKTGFTLGFGVPQGSAIVLDEAARLQLVGLLKRALSEQDVSSEVGRARQRAEAALADLKWPILGPQQIALWKEGGRASGMDAVDLFLEGWVLKSRLPNGSFVFYKEFYVKDEDSVDQLGVWRGARAVVGQSVELQIEDHLGELTPIEGREGS
jgi:hypothetical protein